MGIGVGLVYGEGPGWTGWRGEGRDGVVRDFKVPEVWPEGLELGWRVEVGDGYATPLVVGERVFVHAREGGEEVVLCLDRKTGKRIWREGVKVEFVAGRGGERHRLGPKSTPTFGDGRVFTLSITGVLSAWGADDGKLLWRRDFAERFEVSHPYWGTANSPLLEGGRLYAYAGSCEKGALFCIDPATGKDVWVREEEANCYSSPIVEVLEGVRQMVAFNHDGLCGIDLESGKLLWKHPFPHLGNNQNTPTPVRCGDLLVCGGENRGVFAVRPKLAGGKWSVEPVWRHRDVSLDMSSLLVNDGLVFGFSHLKMGRVFCLDPESGEVLWEGEPRAGDNALFLGVPGYTVALTNRGVMQVMRTTREGCEIVRTYRMAEGDTWAAPALVGGEWLIRERKHLVLWRMPEVEGGGKDGEEK